MLQVYYYTVWVSAEEVFKGFLLCLSNVRYIQPQSTEWDISWEVKCSLIFFHCSYGAVLKSRIYTFFLNTTKTLLLQFLCNIAKRHIWVKYTKGFDGTGINTYTLLICVIINVTFTTNNMAICMWFYFSFQCGYIL